MLSNNNDTRRFSYAEPVLYRGSSYPSADTTIVDDRGIERKGRIFADANGEYYTLDSQGNALPAMLTETLPEVVVTPSREEALSTMFNDYLTRSDKTRMNNVPHREYNPWLRESAQKGAREHALWDKEHPNLSAWRDFGTAIPFGVAAIPLAGGLGETVIGQAVINCVGKVMANPAVKVADSALGLGFGAHGAYNVSQGDYTPTTLLELAGAYPGIKAANGLINSTKVSKEPFVSELDWTPDSWFKTYRPSYSAEDAIALKSHIPEYHRIEQQAKANGTWLQMPDGSTWQGDPRGWVMYKSKNVRDNYRDEVLSHGENVYLGPDKMSFYTDMNGNDISGEAIGTKPIWTSTNPKIGATYGNDVFPIVIPKDANIKTVADAQGRSFKEVSPNTGPDKDSYPYLDTNRIVYSNLTDDNVIRVNNVVDPGSNISILKLEKEADPNETVSDYLNKVYIGDDLVLGKNVRRKSLYGNNGNFDLSNPDIYKGLIPLIFGTPTAFSINQNNR